MSHLTIPSSSASNTSSASNINSASISLGGGTVATGGNANNNLPFEKDKIWYFSSDQLANSPSRRCGIKSDEELHYRQLTAYLIQEMGQRLQVSQLCINTAIVYMHRFYAFHSFTHFHRISMASASLFLAAKVEEQPRKLEHVIRAANKCLPPTTEQNYADLAQELVFNENVLLQTLGFDVAIDHPHTHVVRTCQLVKACKDLAQTSYFLASNSLHLTSMCLQYRPTVVACFCIYLACKWSRWEIPQSTEGKHWFYYVDKSVSLELLKQLTDEFISIYEKSPARLKSKLNSIKAIAQGASNRTAANSKDSKPKEDWKMSEMMKGYHSNITAPPELMNGSSDSREQSAQQVAALLPPPAMVPQQRRGEHSHQRTAAIGSSASSSSSNHNKISNYPGSIPPDAHGDHKSKQPSYNNRATSSHQSSSSLASVQRSSNSGMSSNSSSQRSSSGQQARPPPPMDYHKSSRALPSMGLPQHSTHKMPPNPKQQPSLLDSRGSSSSSSSSVIGGGISTKDALKSSNSSGGKIYPNVPPSYGSSNSSSNNLVHGNQQRSSYMSGNNNSGTGSTSGGYHTHRSKSSSSSSSVHNIPLYEQLTTTLPYGHNGVGSNFSSHMPPIQLDVGAGASSQAASTSVPQTQTQQPIKNNSLFSPEWSDIKKETATHYNGLLPPPPHESLGYKLNQHTRKDSPKKERISTSGTPTKKDKHRVSGPSNLPLTSASSSNAASLTMNSISHGLKSMLPPNKKLSTELVVAPNELAGTSRDGSNISALKRANETGNSQCGLNNEDSVPRDKLRKLDSSGLPGYGFNTGNGTLEHEKHAPISMTNGIETTPDLVRSLLKESLCTTNTSLLKPEALTMPGPKPPAELLEPMPPGQQLKKESTMVNSLGLAMPHLQQLRGDVDTDTTKLPDIKQESTTGPSSKSEKKKKKEKHKHKEKDKSKDKSEKEERKKHKKDKQRDRAKDVAGVVTADSLKLVIKTNTVPGNPNGLLAVHATANDSISAPAAPLKLKISKNKLEPSYSMAQATAPTMGPAFVLPATSVAASVASFCGTGMNSAIVSSKKKDREREKDKKSSKNQDYSKYNGSTGSYPGTGSTTITPSTTGTLPLSTTTSTLQPGILMNTLPPTSALPLYTKK
ncbi:cyclin-T [Scaptodrosophila lebanonensis]|uniref:Cyclin-T n=1 Tax=Drosophila lebanonensis TaxID=7225 RepID=A0A6J2UCX8_DROLE|nr:cyclin-T [Scaptodrosophila lebanonensis]